MKVEMRELMWAMGRSVNEAARCHDDTSVIKDQCKGGQEGDQEFKESRDNTIYNMGVKDGIARFVDHLHDAGYSIQAPDGVLIKPYQPEAAEKPEAFSETFFNSYWVNVSN